MNISHIRAPHSEGAPSHALSAAPAAALLIDFDNVTMGMRSDLSKELKNLLKSDVIRGKVTVQRAYADWRRYPQYIVPLSEASVDLIFAPAYGSSKKNATDIRMAIDGIELVFTRPEIGTYILLTGDSDFSSLVLKLKEYGKYVIGVGIQESSSDILVQNCDEYYSYTSLSGLRKAGAGDDRSGQDPWALVERAVDQMTKRRDVMRSDRLKQVMIDLDASFDEKAVGFSKFSRFLTEAAQKGLLKLKKLENGQYEVIPAQGAPSGDTGRSSGRREQEPREPKEAKEPKEPKEPRKRESRAGRDRSAPPAEPAPAAEPEAAPDVVAPSPATDASAPDPTRLRAAYELLVRAVGDLAGDAGGAVRDSDVKRRMLVISEGFDEAELGFGKFSRFLQQAHDHEVIELSRGEQGIYEVRVAKGVAGYASKGPSAPSREAPTVSAAPADAPDPSADGRRLRPRLSARRRGGEADPPSLFDGQAVRVGDSEGLAGLGLPSAPEEIAHYLTSAYRGVGKKTAEALIEVHGSRLFEVMEKDPDAVRSLLPSARAETLLEQWVDDVARRRAETRGPGGHRGGGRSRR